MNGLFFTIGLSMSLLLQVRCDDAQGHTLDFNSLSTGAAEFSQNYEQTLSKLEQNPLNVRAKRSTVTDECHSLQTQSLPGARKSINAAWNNSMTAILSVTNSFNHLRQCASWNIFVSVPCGLKAIVELVSSYRTYKDQISTFMKDFKGAARNTTEDFYHCAQTLLSHSSGSS